MSCNVYANGDEIACKAGGGKVIASFPDVCLTPPPPPAGPIPVPYPNTSFAKDMRDGSKTVKIGGQEVMLKDQSFYKSSPLGNEAATKGQGAGVVTHVITGKTYFISWSMDVKFEGQNVDRHTDMTTSNHASPMANNSVPNMNNGTATGANNIAIDCPPEVHTAIQDEKTRLKEEIKKTTNTNPNRFSKKRWPTIAAQISCPDVLKRIQIRKAMIAVREKEQSECYKSPPVSDEAKEIRKGHIDKIVQEKNGLGHDLKVAQDNNCL